VQTTYIWSELLTIMTAANEHPLVRVARIQKCTVGATMCI